MSDILLVSTWKTACGIAEHSAALRDAVQTQSNHTVDVSTSGLDPTMIYDSGYPIIHLNYQASLHSRWTPEAVRWQQSIGRKVVITYHDTGVPNSDQCKALHAVADAFVIHEPADDLPGALYWRMGVGDALNPFAFARRDRLWAVVDIDPEFDLTYRDPGPCFKAYDAQPVLGTLGFPFPWKNYDQLAKVTGQIGWALVLIAPSATQSQIDEWRSLNPDLWVRTDFVPRSEALSILSGCDATAFTYVCHNTGQSAAILQGIAARKPVYALSTCRQFRALFGDKLGRTAIGWVETFEDLAFSLSHFTRIERIAPPVVALAEQESWRRLGKKYADLYEVLR